MKNALRTSILLFFVFCFGEQSSKAQDRINFEPDPLDYMQVSSSYSYTYGDRAKIDIDSNYAYILRALKESMDSPSSFFVFKYDLQGNLIKKMKLNIQSDNNPSAVEKNYIHILPNNTLLVVIWSQIYTFGTKLISIDANLNNILKTDSLSIYPGNDIDLPKIHIENNKFWILGSFGSPVDSLQVTSYNFNLQKLHEFKVEFFIQRNGNAYTNLFINKQNDNYIISILSNNPNCSGLCRDDGLIVNLYFDSIGNYRFDTIQDPLLSVIKPNTTLSGYNNINNSLLLNQYIYYHIAQEDSFVHVYKWDTLLRTISSISNYKLEYKDIFLTRSNFSYGSKTTFENGDYISSNNFHLYKLTSPISASLDYTSYKPFADSNYTFFHNKYTKVLSYFPTQILKFNGTYYLFAMQSLVDNSLPSILYPVFCLRKLDGKGGLVSGKVYKDLNKNCVNNNTDKPFKNVLLEIANTNNPSKYFVSSMDSGKYEVFVDTGNYTMKSIAPNNYWENCITNQPIQIDTLVSNYSQDFGLKKLVDCPKLSVSISTDRLRICVPNTYYVNYCNRGTVDAVGATVVVDFDSLLTFNAASVPYTNIGNKYTFQIGNINEDSCGQFTVTTTLNCNAVLGTTQCVTAHIYPDTICTPIDPRWDRANVAVDGRCLGDSVLFRIRNIGVGNMSQIKKYIVIEDNVLRIQPINFQLNAGQEILIKRPANGTTQRLYAEQVDYFPYPSNPTAVVENCGGLNPGFVTQFPNNDGADFIAINCTQNRNSFDPNDKEGTPTGFDNQHYIAKKTDINYNIRFQNTGTDTAYDIYVLDTISNKLDVSKLQMGVASHPYSYEISGEGNAVLKVIFRNINLVDSFHNEPLSHGFFTYSIAQDTLNKANDKIYNYAAIYFDANHPVKTNTTLHTVTDSYFRLISSVIENKIKATTNAYPNPFNDKCTIEIKSDNKQNTTYQFKLYNLNGALIQTQTVTNKVELFAADLPAAIYLYRIEHNGELIAAGKIVKE
ncbi:MAG TPA: T9SS type A sorting domain-containing protein [Chitinophagales bacterium]|nr:T9SS type A sorting domain-containing protein [Chitinophagales bacterium]